MDASSASIAHPSGRPTNRLTIRDIASMPLRIPPINQVGQHDNTRSMSGKSSMVTKFVCTPSVLKYKKYQQKLM